MTLFLAQGLGSAMHLATVHLATAMQHDRVFLWAPSTNRMPIPEDRKWWRPFIDPHLQHMNENVRSRLCCDDLSRVRQLLIECASWHWQTSHMVKR